MKTIANWVDTTRHLAVEQQLEHLSLESGFLSNLSQGLRKIIPSLLEALQGSVSLLAGVVAEDTPQTTNTSQLTARQKETLSKLKALDFLVFAETPVQVPENFKGNLHSYLVTLNGLSPKVYSGVNALLGEYNVILSTFVNNKEVHTGLKTHQALFRGVQGAREHREKVIQHYFPKTTGVSRLPLKQVLTKAGEFESTFKEVNKLSTDHSRQNLTQLNAMVAQATDMLKIVLKQIEDHPNDKIGPEATMDISKGAYEIAKEIEHLAGFHYQVMVAIKTVDQLSTTILGE